MVGLARLAGSGGGQEGGPGDRALGRAVSTADGIPAPNARGTAALELQRPAAITSVGSSATKGLVYEASDALLQHRAVGTPQHIPQHHPRTPKQVSEINK